MRAYLSSSAIGSGHQARHRPLATYIYPANQLRAGVGFAASNERLLSLRPYGLLATLTDRTSSLEPAHDGFLLPNSLEPESLRAQWDMLRRQTKNYADGTFTREPSD